VASKRSAGNLHATLTLEIEAFKKNLASASAELAAVGSKFVSIGTEFAKVGAVFATIGIAATKMATDLNKGMANVATLIPGNIERVKELRDSVQDLSVETGKSTDDLVGGLYQVISAFGDTADTAERLKIAAVASVAGLSETSEAIDLISAVTKGYGDTSVEASKKASDLAFTTVRLGQTTFPELAASILKVTDRSHELNISQEELFASFATLTGVTGKAAEVSTQLKAAFEELPTALEKIGYQSGRAAIEQLGLQGSFQAVAKAAKDGHVELKTLVGSSEAAAAISALAGTQAAAYAGKLGDMGKAAGETSKAFKEQSEGINAFGFQTNRVWQEMIKTMQVFGQALIDSFGTEAISGATVLINKMEELNAYFKSDAFPADIENTKRLLIDLFDRAAVAGNLFIAVLEKVLPILDSISRAVLALIQTFEKLGGGSALLGVALPGSGSMAMSNIMADQILKLTGLTKDLSAEEKKQAEMRAKSLSVERERILKLVDVHLALKNVSQSQVEASGTNVKLNNEVGKTGDALKGAGKWLGTYSLLLGGKGSQGAGSSGGGGGRSSLVSASNDAADALKDLRKELLQLQNTEIKDQISKGLADAINPDSSAEVRGSLQKWLTELQEFTEKGLTDAFLASGGVMTEEAQKTIKEIAGYRIKTEMDAQSAIYKDQVSKLPAVLGEMESKYADFGAALGDILGTSIQDALKNGFDTENLSGILDDLSGYFGDKFSESLSKALEGAFNGQGLSGIDFESLGIAAGLDAISQLTNNPDTQDYIEAGATAAGTAIGATVGAPEVGALIGRLVGQLTSSTIAGWIDSSNAETEARHSVEMFMEEILGDMNVLFGDSTRFEEMGWAQAFQQNTGEAFDSFNALGIALTNLAGVSGEVGGQIGFILSENLGGNLDSARLLVQALGLDYAQLEEALIQVGLTGEQSWHQIEVSLQGLGDITGEGLIGVGDLAGAYELLVNTGGRGAMAIQALRDVAIEAGEMGAQSLSQLEQAMLSSGQFTQGEIDRLMTAFQQRGITSMEQLETASDRTLGGIVADLESLGISWGDFGAGIEQTIDSLTDLEERLRGIDTELDVRVNVEYVETNKPGGEVGRTLSEGIIGRSGNNVNISVDASGNGDVEERIKRAIVDTAAIKSLNAFADARIRGYA